LKPNHAEACNNLGAVLARAGRLAEAESLFRRALDANPYLGAAHGNLANVLSDQGRHADAIPEYEAALRLSPSELIEFNLGVNLSQMGRLQEALSCYRNALRRNPDFAPALQKLAWTQSTAMDADAQAYREALDAAERLYRLEGGKPHVLATLAAAYAANARFQEAIDFAQKAQHGAREFGQTRLENQIAMQLESYRAGQRYRIIHRQ
jgi:tetratricopeptide (TPR) repeat protein